MALAPLTLNLKHTMHSHTSSLFHYTRQRNSLVSILKHGLYPNYCEEQFFGAAGKETVGIPMVSFCDIPIMRVQDFCGRYGKFAIAFSKDWALRKKVNPVFYVQSPDLSRTLSFFRSVEKYFSSIYRNGQGNMANAINLLDQKQLNRLADFVRFFQAKYANDTLLGFAKPYQMVKDGKLQVNYVENEWRYILNEAKGVKWLVGKDAYDQWRGDKNKPKPKAPEEVLKMRLTFTVDDVTHLITQNEEDTTKLIQDIRKLKSFCEQGITDEDKYKLVNKVISFEKIENDF